MNDSAQPPRRQQARQGRHFVVALASAACLAALPRTTAAAQTVTAPTMKVMHAFNGTDGQGYGSALIKGKDGKIYGISYGGGTSNSGTIFKMTANGTFTTLHDFDKVKHFANGYSPMGGMVQGTDGNFYGTTNVGGASVLCSGLGCGTIFKMTPGGVLTTLHQFLPEEGAFPGNLIQASDGNFYGTAAGVGPGVCPVGVLDPCKAGSVFRMTPDGTVSILAAFNGFNGNSPTTITQGRDGALYGTLQNTAVNSPCASGQGCGAIFRLTLTGLLSVMEVFAQGSFPSSRLMQASDGLLYGIAEVFGAGPGNSIVYRVASDGTGFSVIDTIPIAGAQDLVALIQAADGRLYAPLATGGPASTYCNLGDCGTITQFGLDGSSSDIYAFNAVKAMAPVSALVEYKPGVFFGTTQYGAVRTTQQGTIYKLTLP